LNDAVAVAETILSDERFVRVSNAERHHFKNQRSISLVRPNPTIRRAAYCRSYHC